ncbi:hypothetical protein GY45DRAFT_438469 [Cubamyces sp. BRFM 1775]|nr:hypothetical protein GY45DRAFT_438469 [Cubamyces sp. BRFM 1775]
MTNPGGLLRKLNFPAELLLVIKELLDPSDLRTHACYYLSSPRVAALYGSAGDPDAFWRLACWNCGIGAGLTPLEHDFDGNPSDDLSDPSWEDIALDSITRDGFCTYPECGERLLEYNRRSMRSVADEITPFRPHHPSDHDHRIAISGHQLFGRMVFKWKRPSLNGYGSPIERDAHLRMSGAPLRWSDYADFESQPDDYPGLYLGEHPLAARSFATFPPVSNMLLVYLASNWEEERISLRLVRPIIVLDIIKMVHKGLDKRLDVVDAYEHMSLHEECIPETWSHADAFRVARNMRSLVSICLMQRLEYEEESEDGPVFSLELV